jgi:3-polyprenyl-4-hydroxybenzoate decarboxylase
MKINNEVYKITSNSIKALSKNSADLTLISDNNIQTISISTIEIYKNNNSKLAVVTRQQAQQVIEENFENYQDFEKELKANSLINDKNVKEIVADSSTLKNEQMIYFICNDESVLKSEVSQNIKNINFNVNDIKFLNDNKKIVVIYKDKKLDKIEKLDLFMLINKLKIF